jgi:outer membrane protein assembly factor BamB
LPAPAYDWLQFNGDPQHSGNNSAERTIHRNNVGSLVQQWQVSLPAASDGAPVLLQSVVTPAGTKDVLYVTTTAGHIVAIDAATGAQVWMQQNGPGACKVNSGGSACYTASSPAIDPNRLYVYSYGPDGNVHKYLVGDGTEVLTGGWPQIATLKGYDEKNASALAFATSGGSTYLYAVNGGYPGDCCDYQGHVTAINLGTGTQKVFNSMCSQFTHHFGPNDPDCNAPHQSGVWARPGVIFDPATDRLLLATGNGSFNGASGGGNWSESILALHPDGSGSGTGPVDSYTPTNYAALDAADADLGSTAPAILPAPPNSNVQHLALQSGKDGKVRLVNLADLSGQGGPRHTGGEIGAVINVPQGNVVLTQPAIWVNPADGATWAFIVNGGGASALKLIIDGSGNPSLAVQWQNGTAGGSPIVANNILYYAGGNAVRALDPTTGTLLWSTPRNGSTHWQSPVVANGALYIADASAHLTAFAGGRSGMLVDPQSGTGTVSNINGLLEPGESVLVEPTWRNITAAAITLTGTASNFGGPAGATYTLNDAAASYGSIAPGASANCFTVTGNCYRVTVSNPATRPAVHWDAVLREALSAGDTETLLLHVGHSFSDVPDTDLMYRNIETLAHNNVTLGYGNGTYGPTASSIRGATAMFIARGAVAPGGDGSLPAAGVVGALPYNCVAGGTSRFADVLPTDGWCKHVHYLANRGVTVTYQCSDVTHACPAAGTTRAAMAVLMAGAVAVGGDAGVPASGTFSDTGAPRSYNCGTPSGSHFSDVLAADPACRHINYLWARGIIDGYGDGTFQPAGNVTRGQMAKFIGNGFALTLY